MLVVEITRIFVSLFLINQKVIIAEKRHETILNEVEHFDQSGMHHVETTEKNPLPPLEGLFYDLSVLHFGEGCFGLCELLTDG